MNHNIPALYKTVFSTRKKWKAKVDQARITGYRRIIASFRATKAVALDNLPPRALAALSDEALGEIIVFFDRCAAEGRRPEK